VALPVRAAAHVLVVYPFTVSESMADDTGVRLIEKIAAEITALGGITVVRGGDTKPVDYRSFARAAGAEVYYSGSIVPVGAGYSAIEQLVSTRSGTVMWSTTMQFRSVADVVGEGAHVHDELLRGEASPPPTAAPTPAPTGS
jgi:TolB-like protein